MKTKVYVFLVFLCLALSLPGPRVFAASTTDPFYLNETSLKLQVGNTYELYLLNSSASEEFHYYYEYPCNWTSSDESVALVNNGYVTIVGKGKSTITATYNGKNYTCKITAYASSYHLTKTEIATKTFSEETLRMTHNDNVSYYGYYVYQINNGIETKCYDCFNINIDSYTGNINLKALQSGTYRIDFYAYVYNEENYQSQSYKASCNVTVKAHGLIEDEVGCALGTKRQLTFGDLTQITFQVENPTIAAVSEQGMITPIAVGSTSITMTGYNELYELESYSCYVAVTNPSVTLEKSYVTLNNSISLDIEGSSYYENIIYKSSNEEVIQADEYSLNAIKEGKATIAAIVDGKKFTFKVEVVNPRLKTDTFLLTKSETAETSLLGLNAALKQEKITYSVGNTKIATVSKDGKITAKSCGNTLLTVKLGDYSFIASISVGNKQSIQAIKNATAALGSIYSQEKRMQKGYYDCSSLIWRSYAPTGVTFGASSYAPTAANIAKYLYDHNKAIAYSYVDPKKLQPGDLIFYGGENNGRFKNIYHVSMFTGITPGYSYSFSTNSYTSYVGQIIHASKGSVIKSTFTETYGEIVMIARPTK